MTTEERNRLIAEEAREVESWPEFGRWVSPGAWLDLQGRPQNHLPIFMLSEGSNPSVEMLAKARSMARRISQIEAHGSNQMGLDVLRRRPQKQDPSDGAAD